MESNVTIKYSPLDTQRTFHESKARFRVFAGGFGAGKTICGAAEAIHQSLWYPKNLGLVGRATYPELRDTTRKEILDFPVVVDGVETSLLGSPLIKDFNKAENQLTFYNDSVILFRALEDSIQKIKSLNLGWFWVDETTEIAEETWLALTGRLRRFSCDHRGWGTTNPEGRDWLWKKFISKPDKDHFLVHAPSTENKHLPPGYVDSLIRTYPEEWVKRYVYASFDTFEGLIYKDFNVSKHTYSGPLEGNGYRFVAIDHGYRNPTCVLWASVDSEGKVKVYDEFYQSGLLVSEIANIIKTKNKDDLVRMYLIDPSCRNRDGKTGRSIIDEFAEYGIYCEPANNDVRAGINHVQEYFHNGKIQIHSDCRNLISELQTYRWKDLRVSTDATAPEKPRKKDDHAVDAARYLINYVYDMPKRKDVTKDYRNYLVRSEPNWMSA